MPRAMDSFRNPSEILKILPKSLKSFEILQDFLKISKISTISFKISPISTISFKISPAELKISRAIRHPTNIQGPQNSGSRGMEYGKKYFRWDAWFRNPWFRILLNYPPFSNLHNRMTILSAALHPSPHTRSLACTLGGSHSAASRGLMRNSWKPMGNQSKSKKINRNQ